MRTKTCLLSILLVLTLVGAAAASTPDGETPANEGVCDPLIGGTPGLFGLCNAYCEAQDCDFEGSVSAQCDPPNPRILINYEKKRKAGDPDMPCIATVTPCRCWEPDELAAIMPTDPTFCANNVAGLTFIGENNPPISQSASVFFGGGEPNDTRTCSYFFFDGTTFITRSEFLTVEEADVCLAQLQARNDFACFP